MAAIRKGIRPEETFTVRCPIRSKPNHCSPQRHTILLWDYLLCSWPQSAKTYDLKKHLLFVAAVRKDIRPEETFTVRCPIREKPNHRSPQRHATLLLDFLFVFVAAVRKDIRPEETFTVRCPIREKPNHCSPQRHTILLLDFLFVFVAAVRKDIRPEETFTVRCPIREKPNHCSPQSIWNVIYSARSNRCHDPTSPNTVPVTQKDSHA